MKNIINKIKKPILIIILIFGISFLAMSTYYQRKENDRLKKQISSMRVENNKNLQKISDLEVENTRLELINQDMWELYYSMVSDYDGEYEYYE